MRNYNLLWGLWAVWAALVVIWLIDIPLDLPAPTYGPMLAAILAVVVLTRFLCNLKRNSSMFSFDKRKNSIDAQQERSEIDNPSALLNSVSPARVRKGTFIAQGTQLAGKLATDGDITVEGDMEGDVQCDNTIKVERTGNVKGELSAQQIIIDGHVEGRVYASVVAILAQGKVTGDIFSAEFSIEKGGIFTGQSHPLEPESHPREALAYTEKSDYTQDDDNVAARTESN